MIKARHLTKRYGSKVALADATFDVKPGRVTGFLGPNGAGKSTSMRLMVGLDRPTSGEVTVAGQRYADLRAPLTMVGTLLDAKAVHPGRTARNHLRSLAATHGIPTRRVDAVLEMTGITQVAGKPVGGFSLGMGQRLGMAAAILGDPQVLILDEPVNGLDPDGVLWVRNFVRAQAAEGRTVLLSSHLMSEMAQTADHVIVLGRGRVIADTPIEELLGRGAPQVHVTTPDAARLTHELRAAHEDLVIDVSNESSFIVRGIHAAQIGQLCAARGIELHELSPISGSLEDAYMSLTREDVEYTSNEMVQA
ncbi:MAG: ATP-binding cassette domain-containing protein [Arachnia sp.]